MYRKLLLVALMGLTFPSIAQKSILPEVLSIPKTGMASMRDNYSYILNQTTVQGSRGSWKNNNRTTFNPSTIQGYCTEIKNSVWNTSDWNDEYTVNDSFVLDNENRFKTVIEDTKYNYPGFTNRSKLKYQFTWQNNLPVVVDVKQANPPTSDTYTNYLNYKIIYDSNGRRITDTMNYVGTTSPYLVNYNYNANNQLLSQIWIDLDPTADHDTMTAQFYTWSGNNLMAVYGIYYDNNTFSMQPQYADTFTYDSQNNIVARVNYVITSVNGSDFVFLPNINETYAYSSSGKLTDISSLYWNETNSDWEKNSKSTFLYDAADEPALGYLYYAPNGTWNTSPDERFLFNSFSGIREIPSVIVTKVYPIPAHDVLYLDTKGQTVSGYKIIDVTGKTVLESNEKLFTGSVSIDIHSLNKGIYSIIIDGTESLTTKKILVE